MTITVRSLPDLSIRGAQSTGLNLLNHFDDPRTTGLVARFELYNATLGGGVTNVVLFDQPGAGAPQTVQNFAQYVTAGAYTNSIIHRLVPGFVIQGGGFTANGLGQTLSNPGAAIGTIPTNPPVQNEFSPGRSNLRGTIAMAKLGDNPNSATSQWFFNLGDNSANLNNQNGGFTVFGQVRTAADLAPVNAIANVSRFNGASFFNQGAFTDIPLIVSNPQSPSITGDENFVRYRSISLSRLSELTFSVVRNTNPNLVTARIINNQLVLNYRPAASRIADITIRATNLLGQSVQDTFRITAPVFATAGNDTLSGTTNNDVIAGLDGNDRIFGLNGNDRLLGQGGADQLQGGNGNDLLFGGLGNDVLIGGEGNDSLFGEAGNDFLTGGNGNDRLNGGAGSNTLVTGAGSDIVQLGRKAFREFDTVIDFTDRVDRIQLIGGLTFGQLSIRQQGVDTLLQVGGSTVMLLRNFRAANLTREDFI